MFTIRSFLYSNEVYYKEVRLYFGTSNVRKGTKKERKKERAFLLWKRNGAGTRSLFSEKERGRNAFLKFEEQPMPWLLYNVHTHLLKPLEYKNVQSKFFLTYPASLHKSSPILVKC